MFMAIYYRGSRLSFEMNLPPILLQRSAFILIFYVILKARNSNATVEVRKAGEGILKAFKNVITFTLPRPSTKVTRSSSETADV